MKGYYTYIYGVLDGSIVAGNNIRLMEEGYKKYDAIVAGR